DKIKSTTFTKVGDETMTVVREIVLLSILAIVIHDVIPYSLEPVVDSLNRSYADGFGTALLRDLLRLVVGYGFYGLLMVLVLMRFPAMAWQIGIALTFSHAAIDLIRDFYPDRPIWSPFTMHFVLAAGMILIVSWLTAYFRRRDYLVYHLSIVLIWACIVESLIRLIISSGGLAVSGMSLGDIVLDRFFVGLFLIFCPVILTLLIIRLRNRQPL